MGAVTTNPAPADVCPTCSAPVIATPSGLLLDPLPHRLGVLRPDGSTLTVRDVLAAHRAGAPVGHCRHTCPPQPGATSPRKTTGAPGQGALFPIADGTDTTRSER